ncbi:hypothetical protein [Flavobacterium cerinum]|uniref:Phage abortive infection protein n=1 Tax=Flavobacterium cerinum TaxID=2502784 RepID=A0A444HF00_9FLAO|nr:hypothetical protein [Flavobacterium cerinum]RWX03567.1 hypothetical protein EPI11_01160 [Flavobacterium cerinum]
MIGKNLIFNRLEGMGLCIALIIAATPAIYFFPATDIPLDSKQKFEFGVNIAQLIAPLFTLIGFILVYVAFKEQIKANRLTQNQFIHSQVAGMFESLRNNISNFVIDRGGEEIKGYHIFRYILKEYIMNQKEIIYRENYVFSILSSIPEEVSDSDYAQFISLYDKRVYNEEERIIKGRELREYLIANRNDNYLYDNFGNEEYTTEETDMARSKYWKRIANIYFYFLDFESKIDVYERAYRVIYKEYEIFLDAYFNQVYAIFDLLYHSQPEEINTQRYIKNAFTNQEKVLLYNKLMTGTSTREFGQYLLELKVFNFVMTKELFLTGMNVIQCNKEIENIKLLIYKTDQQTN